MFFDNQGLDVLLRQVVGSEASNVTGFSEEEKERIKAAAAKSLKELISALLTLIELRKCEAEFERIVSGKITDENELEALFWRLWNRIDDENRFWVLFWKLINYVETFDWCMGRFWRRYEEVYFEGL